MSRRDAADPLSQASALAYDVFHYDYALAALLQADRAIETFTPWTPQPVVAAIAGRLPLPGLMTRLSRRPPRAARRGEIRHGLGVGELVRPAARRVGSRATQRRTGEALLAMQGRRIARLARGGLILHAVDGLGLEAMTGGKFELNVLEKRNLHERAFRIEPIPGSSFPYDDFADDHESLDRYGAELEVCDRLVVYSETAARTYSEAGVPRARISLVPLGSDKPPITVDQIQDVRRHDLLFIGRGTPDKGLDLAVAATESLGAPYRLIVAGALTPNVARWIAKRPRVDYLGFVDRRTLERLAQQCALLIAPSSESFGLAALDAVRQGVHLLCSNKTGIGEWLSDRACTQIQQRAPEAWASAIALLTSSPYVLDPAARVEAAESSGGLTWSASTQHLLDVFLRLG